MSIQNKISNKNVIFVDSFDDVDALDMTVNSTQHKDIKNLSITQSK